MPIAPENRARYPKNWREISTRIRFQRAEGRCECTGQCGKCKLGSRCEMRHGHPNPRTGRTVTLTTAHVDHIPEHCDDDNLLALCNFCHLSMDAAHHAANAKRTREAKRRAILEKAGQIAFALECETGKPVGRIGQRPARTV